MKIASVLMRLASGEAGSVFRGMATLAMGAGAARVIGIAAIPLLTRIYSPEDYGVLAVYTSLVVILAPFLTLRYVLAIPLPRREGTAFNLLALALCLMVLSGLLIILIFWAAGPTLFQLLSMEVLAPWWWLVVLGAIGAAIYEALSMWATRHKAYRIIAKTQITQSLLGEGIKLILGVLAFKPFGLLLGQFASLSGGAGAFLFQFWSDFGKQRKKLAWKRMWFLACYYRGYPTYRLFSQVLLIFSTQAPLILTAAYFNAEVTGQLGLAMMALSLPANLLGETMSKAFYAEISAMGRKETERVRRLAYAVICRLAILSIVPSFVLLVWGELLFSFAFGTEWALAGKLASVLAIYLAFQFIQKPVSYLMFVFDGQKELLYLNVQRVALTVFCFYLGGCFGLDILKVVLLYSVVLSFHYVFSIILALKKIPNRV